MTTTVLNTKTQPAIVMDKLHIDSLTFQQARENDPNRVIGGSAVLYGLDADGAKVFDFETFSISDKNLDATIVGEHIVNGGTVDSFVLEYNTAKVQVNDAIVAGTLTDAQLMAYYEAALGRMFELCGTVNIVGVE